jgi:hypothetical protein
MSVQPSMQAMIASVMIERIPHMMTDKPIVLDIMDQHFSITKNHTRLLTKSRLSLR